MYYYSFLYLSAVRVRIANHWKKVKANTLQMQMKTKIDVVNKIDILIATIISKETY